MSDMNDIRTKFQIGINKLFEDMAPVKIGDEVIGTIDSTNQDLIDDIKSLVLSAGSRGAIVEFLVSIGFPLDRAMDMFTVLSKSKDIDTTAKYLLSRDITMGSLLNKKYNSKDLNSRIGLSGKPSDLFYGFSWRTSPPMGPGEVWLSTILKGGRRPDGGEKGDVIVDDIELEVKGPNGRLIGQSGYGDAKQMRTAFATAMENIAKSLKIKDFTVIDTGKDNYWNITKSEARGVGENLKAISNAYGKAFKKRELSIISREIINVYNSYLIGLDVKKYGDVLSNVIGSDGTVDTTKWHLEVITMYFEYYHSIEGFEYIAFTKSNGDFLISDVTKFREFYASGAIKATALPSFTNGAGVQGGTYGVTLV